MTPEKINELIRTRRSIYPQMMIDKPISDEIIWNLLENANHAPTHRLTEPWRFKVFTDTAKVADLHLPLKPNSDIDFFNLVSKRIIDEELIDEEFIKIHVNNYELLKNKFKRVPVTKMLKRTGLTKEQFEEFWLLYKNSENIISAWTMGLNQSSQGVDKNLA